MNNIHEHFMNNSSNFRRGGPVNFIFGPVNFIFGPVNFIFGPVNFIFGPVNFIFGPVNWQLEVGGGGNCPPTPPKFPPLKIFIQEQRSYLVIFIIFRSKCFVDVEK